MHRILKYEIKITDEQVIEIPNGAEILIINTHVDSDGIEKIFIWAKVLEGAGIGKRKILMFATENKIDSEKELIYLGSVKKINLNKYHCIYHIFEEK